MQLLPLTVTRPFGDYKHGDIIDTEAEVMAALEHHPHFVVQIAGEVKSAADATDPALASQNTAKKSPK